ncbi:unnamed protein product [Brassicogethes aeneus]|uniref:FP protein C-terminal domain-containing protein n=1 Tax=Brassicogethes aeneus TaxID=1431903 RepID=A0A9P0B6F0_BRAAE|nr:unnamed protein product [Brassicogethes aeneus]
MTCPKCSITLENGTYSVQCSSKCGTWYHLTAKCTGLSKTNLQKVKKKELNWACGKCNEGSSSEDSCSDEENIITNTRNTRNSKKVSSKNTKITASQNIKSPKITKTEPNKTLIDYIDKRFNDLEKSLTFYGDIIEDVRKSVAVISDNYKKLHKEHESTKKKVAELQREIHLLKQKKHDTFDEHKEKNDVLIGLTSKTDEEAKNDAQKILSYLDVVTQDCTVKGLAGNGPRGHPFLITFKNVQDRNQMFDKRKLKGKIESSSCKLSGDNRNIYINEDMSKDSRVLFNKARSLKEKGYKYVWCKNGLVFCRETESSKILLLRSSEQIDKIISEVPVTNSTQDNV